MCASYLWHLKNMVNLQNLNICFPEILAFGVLPRTLSNEFAVSYVTYLPYEAISNLTM